MIIGISQRIDYIGSYNEIRDSIDQRLTKWVLKLGRTPVAIPSTLIDVSDTSNSQFYMLEKWLTKLSIESLILSGGNNIGEFPQRDMTEKPYSILLAIISSESKMDKKTLLVDNSDGKLPYISTMQLDK